ncbi:DUF2500 domain-containing protein [Cohnella pontilimi]|uniref:DUF2500 domain-containing protein n=1 Tax=Cohnella pontilimi TaxID=2564100 RepID=A0A4U0FL60_9BACL|nr:DUF2500 domain-containing protein [Cohnella pontilimi]TJY44302.1 DUF2500 domain-containing protein [Cohnella pontilimi]
MFPPSDAGFGFFGILFPLVFFVIIGVIVFSIGKGILQWSRNNAQPVLTVEARLVSKRTDVSHSHGGGVNDHSVHSSTWYYATFEVESGDRMEFAIQGHEFGLLADGDFGKLTFQGTRYLGFQRERSVEAF